MSAVCRRRAVGRASTVVVHNFEVVRCSAPVFFLVAETLSSKYCHLLSDTFRKTFQGAALYLRVSVVSRSQGCQDGFDLSHCGTPEFCHFPEYHCPAEGCCLPQSWRRDGIRDCKDGSDEAECQLAGLCPESVSSMVDWLKPHRKTNGL